MSSENLDPASSIRQQYDIHLDRLEQLHKSLITVDPNQFQLEPPFTEEEQPEITYPTLFGEVTFAQIHERTHRIAGFEMQAQLGMDNPADIDDCLQSGYLKIWRKLQKNPEMFADKPKRYLVKSVVLHSKAQRFAHNRHYRKLAFHKNVELQFERRPELTIPQAETWMDLAAAINQVAQNVDNQQYLLVSLYTLITNVSVAETAAIFGYSDRTIYKYRRQMKDALASYLPEYRPQSSDIDETQSPYPAPLVMPLLMSAIHMKDDVNQQQQLKEDQAWFAQMTRRNQVRRQVQPFQPQIDFFPTGWLKEASLEQIINDPQLRRGAFSKLSHLGVWDEHDQEDCFQRGTIRLWHKLKEQPDLLADKGPIWAGIYVAYQGDTRQVRRHSKRVQRFKSSDFDMETADEYRQLGNGDGHQSHAEWTQRIDDETDFAGVIQELAQRYDDDLPKLLALYALTTSAAVKDVAPLAGIHPKNFSAMAGRQVKEDLRKALSSSEVR